MDTPAIAPHAAIEPLIARHAEDAAFYWSQLDSASHSIQIGLPKYAHFNRLLDAHLEGLAVAGQEGLRLTQAALQRWKGPAETFACTWLAVTLDDTPTIEHVFSQLRKQPDTLLRGVVSALAWVPPASSLPWITRLGAADGDVPAQVAALRVAALIGADGITALPSPLTTYLASPHAFIRAAACRAARRDDERCTSTLAPALRSALLDTDLAVRAEAAIALARCGIAENAVAVLWQCVAAQSDVHRQATGWYRKPAARRLQRWIEHLAVMTPLGHPDIRQLLNSLPARFGLTFILHHGDSGYLPQVLEYMKDPHVARYAGWVWQSLTGLDLAANGWTASETDPGADSENDAITEARLDADQGLPLPDLRAIQAASFAHVNAISAGVRSLLGKVLTSKHALGLLEHAPQVLRGIAAQVLMQVLPGVQLSVRGPASNQLRQLAYLQTLENL